MTKVYLAVGSNLGRREANIELAKAKLSATSGVQFVQSAALYETDPVGGAPQGKYLNSVFELETSLEARALLAQIHEIEAQMGRVRAVRNEARVIDLDILYFGEEQIESAELTVPHPRMYEREFVLKPLREIAGSWLDPVLQVTVNELYERFHEKDRLVCTNAANLKRA